MIKKVTKPFVVDKKEIPSDKNAYIFRNPTNNNRWYLYFYDKNADKRYRYVLKDGNGKYPEPTINGQDEAWMIGISKFVELKGKSDRGEVISQITFGELCRKFLAKEKRRISSTPHQGITKVRYRLLDNQIRWIRDFVNNDKKGIHKFNRNSFLNYEVWRKERAIELDKEPPQPTTISHELSCLRRLFNETAVANGYLTRATIPEIPSVKFPKNKKHRRDDFTEKEWLEIEKVTRLYFIKGRTRILDDDYTIEKHKNGQYKTRTIVTRVSNRGRHQLTHHIMFYWGIRLLMDTGMRIGSCRSLRWRDISPNTTLPKEEQKLWVSIDVPPENTKTGRAYRCAAPIAKHLQQIRKVSVWKKPNDLIFCNQQKGTPWSERIWRDYFCKILVEARLADWNRELDKNGMRALNIHSGKNLTLYSFRHTHITMRLKAGVPVPTIAANTDTSMKYIQEHYFHYRADEATEELGRGRKLKSSLTELLWLDEVETG